MGARDYWVIIFFAALCFRAEALNPQNQSCSSTDFNALLAFQKGVDPKPYGWDTSSSSGCCNWPGITCASASSLGLTGSADSARVVKLDLRKARLSGLLSDSFAGLDQLRYLNLSRNSLRGPLPVSVFHLQHLEVLDLSFNYFHGPVPATIDLPSLRTLDLSSNSVNGSLPSHICDNSTGITELKLAVNYFSGAIPPELGNCGSLEHLCLAMNDLTGEIGEEIFGLPNLARVSLQDNKLSGKLSSGIGNLSNLVQFDISSNMFAGNIPDVFHNLKKLESFTAPSNNFTGGIPFSLANSGSITSLNLRNNSLSGPIELNCSAMTSLVFLDLGSNQFVGSVPDNLPSCQKLEDVNLAKNNFTGQIPESFKNFQSLSYLSLSNASLSNLSSALGILQQCKNLTTLVLTLNFHHEELPPDPDLHFENLKVLIIANCRLRGSVPQWLRGSTRLQLLDLSWNHLGGSLPAWFGSFEFLFYLDLSNNSFTGEIPKSITGLKSLIDRNVSLTDPSDIPFFVKRNVTTRGLQYNQVSSLPPTLNLGCNHLYGPIWPEFGNLKKLHVLDLKSNNLSGSIPNDLSGMVSLETLDLSHNNLTGTIPSSLVRLTFLSKFSIAYTRLSGRIPSGGQFQTFPNISFEGTDLCGYHAPRACLVTLVYNPLPPLNKSKRSKGVLVGMAVGIAFGTIFLLSLMFLIVLRAHTRRVVDPVEEDEEDSSSNKDLKVVLFPNKENHRELSLEDLLQSTNNFDQANIIGCGGFGMVYKATLPDGRKVAIKRLTGDCGQMDREFHAEVETLSKAQHPNLVRLQGFCVYKSDRLLIYSFMENSSLDYWLHEKPDGPPSLDWDTRLHIAQGAARGLAYLHQSCDPHVLHRDIKSSNILLDENFEAYLADFGLARLILPQDTHVTTDLVGTLGYIPPEYGQASVATYKGDVYSFGVVLLELLTGKRPMDMCKPRGSRDLISWVIQMKKENRESEVFDAFIYDEEHKKELLRVLEISCLCLNESPKERPSTQQLVPWLDNIGSFK